MSIVLIGSLDLTQLHPQWFVNRGLLGEAEATSAVIQMVHKETVAFSVPQAFEITGDGQRLQFNTAEPEWFESVRDLALGVVRELGTDELVSFGVNRVGHWQLESRSALERFFAQIIPQQSREAVGDGAEVRSVGLTTKALHGFAGSFNVNIEPSVHFNHGVFIGTNQHFELRAQGTDRPTTLGEVLDELWPELNSQVEGTFDRLLALGVQP